MTSKNEMQIFINEIIMRLDAILEGVQRLEAEKAELVECLGNYYNCHKMDDYVYLNKKAKKLLQKHK